MSVDLIVIILGMFGLVILENSKFVVAKCGKDIVR